jgi:hypothetical protein
MSSNGDASPPPAAGAGLAVGLPPVEPPSGKLLFRMFVTPALIVAGVVLAVYIWLQGLNWFFGISYSPEEFLHKLDDPNPEVRWRAAHDLAQVLPRDPKLAANPRFALQLADRLQKAIDANRDSEQTLADRANRLSAEELTRERKKLEADRNYIEYLIACQGRFVVPPGVPLLKEIAAQDAGVEPVELAARRRMAVWALANLGEGLKRFDAMSAEEQEDVIYKLDKAGDELGRPEWSRAAVQYLRNRRDGRPDTFGVDRVMEKCANSDDSSLRYHAAFALNFWSGSEAENARIENMLVGLTNDDGHGDNPLAALYADDPNEKQETTKRPGMNVRINAAIALARRGSTRTPVDLLADMLDPEVLGETFILKQADGSEHPYEAKVVGTMIETLKAAAELHRLRPTMDLSSLRPAVDRLAAHDNKDLREQAEKTRAELAAAD